MSEQKTHLIAVGLRLLFRFFLYSNRFIITIWIYLLRQKYYAAIIGAFTYFIGWKLMADKCFAILLLLLLLCE